jgi:hypothetical protein
MAIIESEAVAADLDVRASEVPNPKQSAGSFEPTE